MGANNTIEVCYHLQTIRIIDLVYFVLVVFIKYKD